MIGSYFYDNNDYYREYNLNNLIKFCRQLTPQFVIWPAANGPQKPGLGISHPHCTGNNIAVA